MIQSIAFTGYPVTEMSRARRFYEQTLGLRVESNYQDQWVEYDVRGSTFALTTMGAGQPSDKGPFIAFEVDDLDQTIAHLRQQGVRFKTDVVDTPVCRMCIVLDPDGNALVIHRCKPSRSPAS